ncbi:permease prefix domain 1-containing protein [Promicromonospora sp. MEB111]|uniref:permease prefix domain 1-containing protein n=1 Tax=Promicromonospora sp. MEB111 TaxID=3040301 RepID=UPI0025500F36|nr:permease prefix domain 1-containing protein [Promicromonospora sp. MEB111]
MTNTSVHRLLDEAFAGIPTTPDVQDLKEEIRANLLDRVAELTAGGVAPDDAARRAVAELGDVRALVDEADAGPRAAERPAPSAFELMTRNRVPASGAFVAAVVLMSIVLAASVVGTVFAAVGYAHRDLGPLLPTVLALVAGCALGWIVGGSLSQETTASHPVPRRRAALFGVGWGLVLVGALLALVHLFGGTNGWLVLDGLVLVAGVVLLSWLAATTTNRKKQWALAEESVHAQAGTRFDRDPAAAARFGIYTVVVWSLTGVAALVVGTTVSWSWVWLPGVLGWVVFMLMLATMLFGARHEDDARQAG